jgi:lysozyme
VSTTRARGLDLSSVQGEVDFEKIKAAGYDWVTLKATQGAGGTDSKWAEYSAAARKAGLLIDAYHFLTVGSPVDAQIKHFADVALGLVDLPPSIDFEYPAPKDWPGGAGGAFARDLPKRCLDACLATEATFGRCCVYTYPDFALHLPRTQELISVVQRPLWLAYYPHERSEPIDQEEPKIPEPWSKWMFFQWSGNGGLAAPGVSCVVDHDLFNGTPADLQKLLISTSESFPGPASVSSP